MARFTAINAVNVTGVDEKPLDIYDLSLTSRRYASYAVETFHSSGFAIVLVGSGACSVNALRFKIIAGFAEVLILPCSRSVFSPGRISFSPIAFSGDFPVFPCQEFPICF